MKLRSPSAAGAALFLACLAVNPSSSQTAGDAQDIRGFFSGQTMLVTYRNGGPVYGTHYILYVTFCSSGTYFTRGESSRHTVLDNEERHPINDRGRWDVASFGGQAVLRYLSVSGQSNAVPIRLLPNGRVMAGNGVTVIRQGPAPCR